MDFDFAILMKDILLTVNSVRVTASGCHKIVTHKNLRICSELNYHLIIKLYALLCFRSKSRVGSVILLSWMNNLSIVFYCLKWFLKNSYYYSFYLRQRLRLLYFYTFCTKRVKSQYSHIPPYEHLKLGQSKTYKLQSTTPPSAQFRQFS